MKRIVHLITLLCLSSNAFSQDDLLKMLDQEKTAKTGEVVKHTFKGTRIISAQTTEMLSKRNLDFRVAHRFGELAEGPNGFDINGARLFHSGFGFDNSSDIRIAFEYGITDNFMTGVSRSKYNESYEGFIKYRLFEQTTDNKRPVSLAFLANAVMNGQAKSGRAEFSNFAHRFSYLFQGIIARKFSSAFSLELLPTFLHRNYVSNPADKNDLFSIGAGGRLRLTRSSALIADYFYNFSDYLTSGNGFYMPLGIGYEVETGGHVFSLMFVNSAGIIENNFLASTQDSWLKGGFRFSFNISRIFKV